jgi:NADPH-dependent curcumin reductase CurA
MSVPSHADIIVLKRRPGPSLRAGDLAPERRPLRARGLGEVVVRNLVTSVDPYHLRMLRGSPEVTPVRIGEPVPANSVGVVVQSEDRGVPLGTQVATYTGWQAIAGGRHRTDRAVQVLGADVAVDYRDPDLEEAASEGIDVFFDNVGGRQLTLALSVLKNYASVVLCGWVSSYARPDDPERCAVLRDAVFKRITLRGFIVSDSTPSGCFRSVRSSRRCCERSS